MRTIGPGLGRKNHPRSPISPNGQKHLIGRRVAPNFTLPRMPLGIDCSQPGGTMKIHRYSVLGLCLLLPIAALADFHYQESSQITGGSMLGMIQFAGKFSRHARDASAPTVTTIYVSGNKMARVSPQTIEIVDLDAETITNVDLQKRTYYQMTFEQMRQQLAQAAQQIEDKQASQPSQSQPPPQAPNNVDVQFKVNVRNTGATKQVSGLNASESILTMQLQGTDKSNGQTGAFAITNDMWMTQDIPGYGELQDFYRKYAAKMGNAFSEGLGNITHSLAASNPGAAQGMSSLMKEVSTLKGIPVQQIMRMGATADGSPLPAASEAPLPQSSPGPQTPSAGDVARQSTQSAIASKLGGFGFGGFGHKKKESPPPDDSANTQAAPTATVLMEMQTEMTAFSTAPIDPGTFAVPAGFRQVQSLQMK